MANGDGIASGSIGVTDTHHLDPRGVRWELMPHLGGRRPRCRWARVGRSIRSIGIWRISTCRMSNLGDAPGRRFTRTEGALIIGNPVVSGFE